jgi:uncharacterized protein
MRPALMLTLLCAGLAGCGGTAPAAPAADCTGVPKLTGRVVDEAKLLSPGAQARLTGELRRLEAATSDQLVVVTLPSLGGRSIEDVGLATGRCWRIGRKGVDNGVLVLVAPAGRKVRIEVGTGLEGLLTDPRAMAIIDEAMLPRFRDRQMETGIEGGVARIDALLRSDTRRPQRLPPPAKS